MSWELVLWLLSFVAIIALLVLAFIQFISLDDLECDYINPYDSSSRVNSCVIPEFVIQGALSVVLFLTFHWFMFLISVPVMYYHIKLYSAIGIYYISIYIYLELNKYCGSLFLQDLYEYMEGKHLVDVTEIFRSVNKEKRHRQFKIGFYICLFFIIIFRLVMTSVNLLMDEDDRFDSGFIPGS